MKLLIENLRLEIIPNPPVIAGEAPPENINKYRILNEDVIENWTYFIKESKFNEVYIIDKIIYSINNININSNLSLYICQREEIKRDIVLKGKIDKDKMIRDLFNVEHKINGINSKIDIICRILNLNI